MSVTRASKPSTFAAPASPAIRLRLTPVGLCGRSLSHRRVSGLSSLTMEPLP